MDFKSLIGQIFKEQEFYGLLLQELEDKFEQNFNKYIHFYFERPTNDKIKITELACFKSSAEMTIASKQIIEKKEWYEIAENQCHLNLDLVRLDRTGFFSAIWKDHTRTEKCTHSWADEGPSHEPLSPDEMRQAFLELMGIFEEGQEQKNQNLKKPYNLNPVFKNCSGIVNFNDSFTTSRAFPVRTVFNLLLAMFCDKVIIFL